MPDDTEVIVQLMAALVVMIRGSMRQRKRTTFLDVDAFNSAWRIKTVRLLPLLPSHNMRVVSFDCCMRSQVTELGARVEENPDLGGLFVTLVAQMDRCDALPDVIPTISKIVCNDLANGDHALCLDALLDLCVRWSSAALHELLVHIAAGGGLARLIELAQNPPLQ